jgi:hypothetical protein
MMKSENHTPEHFRELLFHDPASGVMHWKRKVNPHVNPGDVAGCIDGDSYRIISVGDARCLAYVLAFVIANGRWRKDQAVPDPEAALRSMLAVWLKTGSEEQAWDRPSSLCSRDTRIRP